MAEWVVITVEHLSDYLVNAAMVALRSAALGAGQTDPFSRVMPDIASRIRNEVQACRSNLVGATPNSIPPELKTIACLMIIEAMQGRLPGVELTEGHKAALEDGRNLLRRISKCEVPVTTPDDPLNPPQVQTGGVQLVSSSHRLTTRHQLSGL